MDKFQSKTAKIPNRLPKGGRPVMGKELEGTELKDYLYHNKITKKIEIKLTGYEYDLLNEKHKKIKEIVNIDRSSFIKNNIFNDDSANLIKQMNNAELVIQLNRIGVNINQMVKKINGYTFITPAITHQIKNVEKEIIVIKDIFSKII